MKQQRFTPHSRSCQDPDCSGKCAVLRVSDEGEVVLSPDESDVALSLVVPSTPSGVTSIGRNLIQQMVNTGAINSVSCIWEDTSPSYTIQMSGDYKPGQAADLLSLLAHFHVPVRIVDHMTDDCKGRRIL
jgi:hypothetical protein